MPSNRPCTSVAPLPAAASSVTRTEDRIRLDPLYRASHRSGHRALRRQRRRLVRQRPCRDGDRPVQDRGDPSARSVALLRDRRVRHPRTGRLVQHTPAARTDRQRASRQGRSALLYPDREASLDRLTHTKRPPGNPGRFSLPNPLALHASWPTSTMTTHKPGCSSRHPYRLA